METTIQDRIGRHGNQWVDLNGIKEYIESIIEMIDDMTIEYGCLEKENKELKEEIEDNKTRIQELQDEILELKHDIDSINLLG